MKKKTKKRNEKRKENRFGLVWFVCLMVCQPSKII